MKKKPKEYVVILHKLEGKSLRTSSPNTDKVCHIHSKEIQPGVVLLYAIDVYDKKIYIDPNVRLTW